jgi:hypothetical protein
VASKKVKLVADLSEREKRHQRRLWRNQWNNRKNRQDLNNRGSSGSTPHTPLVQQITNICITQASSPHTPVVQQVTNICISHSSCESRQKKSGRKQISRRRSAAYRHMKVLEAHLKKSELINRRLRKRLIRQQKRLEQTQMETSAYSEENTPTKCTRAVMTSPRKARKALLFHYSLMQDMRRKLTCLQGKKRTAALSLFSAAKLLKKHRLYSVLRRYTGLSRKRLQDRKSARFEIQRRTVTDQKKKAVTDFFERDDVSRPTAGKRETLTRMKVKKQKRFLLDPLSKLYNRFQVMHSEIAISFATFARLKPFWIVRPRISDRDTCLCKLHENTMLLHDKLKQLKCMESISLDDAVKGVVCSVKNRLCMFGECSHCANRIPAYSSRCPSDDEVAR